MTPWHITALKWLAMCRQAAGVLPPNIVLGPKFISAIGPLTWPANADNDNG